MNLKPFILLYAIFHFSALFGQVGDKIDRIDRDKIYHQLHELNGKEKIDAFNKLALAYSKDCPDSCILFASRARLLSEKHDYQKGIADAILYTGNAYFYLDSLKPTITNFLKAIRHYEDLGPSVELGYALKMMHYINFLTRRYQEAKYYGRRAAQTFATLEEHDYYCSSLITLGLVCAENKEYDSARYYQDNTLRILDKHPNTLLRSLVYFYKAYGTNSINDSAIHWYVAALDLDTISPIIEATIYNNLGYLYSNEDSGKSTDQGLEYFTKALEIINSLKIRAALIITIHRGLAQMEHQKRNYNEAIKLLEKGIRDGKQRMSEFSISNYTDPSEIIMDKFYYKRQLNRAYSLLYDIHIQKGDSANALSYYILKQKIAEDIVQYDNKNLFTLLETVSNNEKVEEQLILLERDKQINELKASRSQNILFTVIAFFILITIIGIIFIRQRKIRIEQNNLIQKQKLQHDLELQNVESDKLRELGKIKTRFFANISHEFRTPLTLILGPLEKLKTKINDGELNTDLIIAQRNAQRLQNLINQLLSLSKLESGKMKLRLQERDIITLVKGYVQSFESLATQNGLNLLFIAKKDDIPPCWIDQDKLEKILYNLISNAFKHTGEGGRIIVRLAIDREELKQTAKNHKPKAVQKIQAVEITVTDTGHGIPPDHLPHIFDRFYQADTNYSNDQEGSGIGLALTKELVDLHQGTIHVESELNKGSTFILKLPMGKDHYHPEDFVPVDEMKDKNADSLNLVEQGNVLEKIELEAINEDDTKPLLLIVEDNADMRYYIRTNICSEFRLSEAENGQQGFEIAIEKVPDLIISDVMMPKMDGIAFCNKIKTDERTSHIPVILLTAKASMEDRLEGLQTGADDFLTKPFDQQELLVRVKNLILQRKTLSDRLMKNAKKLGLSQVLNLPESELNSTDQKFLLKAIESVNTHLQDESFNAKSLHKELLISNSQLYRKLKMLVGMSTSGFIRSIRLTRAAELLKAKNGNVSEVAFEVGFNNLSYFSKCFEEQFGVLPSEYNT